MRAVIQVESAFNPIAVSPKGAMGLMQLMPATARELGVERPVSSRARTSAAASPTSGACSIATSDNVELALAAYNAGPGNVERTATIPPYRETQAYVKKVDGARGPRPRPRRRIRPSTSGSTRGRQGHHPLLEQAPKGVYAVRGREAEVGVYLRS